MVRCEDSLLEKEKDSTFLKFTLHELKKSFNEKSEEVDLLKVKNINIENEMKLIKDQNQELKKHFEMKNEILTSKNQLLENQLDSFGKQLLHQTKSLEDEQAQMKDMKCEAEDVKNEITEKSNLNQEEIEKVKMQLNKSLELSNSINNDVKKLKADVMATSIEIDTGKCQLNEKLNEKTDEINKLSAEVATTEKVLKDKYNKLKGKIKKCINSGESNFNRLNGKLNQGMNLITNCQKNIDQMKEKIDDQIDAMENVIKDNFSTLNDKINNEAEGVNLINDPQKEVDEEMKNIAKLKCHVNNIENTLFCDSSGGSKEILSKWKLQNYQYHFDIGEPVWSPIFPTQKKGYCFELAVKWSGENKENLGLFLWVCRGSNYDKPLEPFKMPYSLEMVDNIGNIFSVKVSLSEIEVERENCFTLPPGQNKCKHGYGRSQFLSMPDLNNYILNDMLSIQCRLTPS